MSREKVFGSGRPLPLDRNAKARVLALGRALMRRTEKGKAYGQLTAKAYAVLSALLYGFHNSKSGLCFPSLAKIAEAAACSESSVQRAIAALEACGLLSWVNRLVRRREYGPTGWRWRVYRTSNAYRFNDRPSFRSNGQNPRETNNQAFSFNRTKPKATPQPDLFAGLTGDGSAADWLRRYRALRQAESL